MELKNIFESQKKNIMENIGIYLRQPWYFDSSWEKIILFLLTVFGLWKIINIVGGLI
jgi:hypothetical protein